MEQQSNLIQQNPKLQALKEPLFFSESYIQPIHKQKQMQDEDLLQYEEQTKPQQVSNQQQEYQPLDSYIISKTLGKGNFGKVKLAMHKLTRQYVAVKILQKDLIFQNTDIVRITRELKIMKKLRHPFVVQLYQIIQTAKQLYLIMEYAQGGDLFQKIVNQERIKQKQAAKIYTQIVLGMDYFHSKGVTHRDLKPQNILMSKDGTIKIADFGLGNMFKPQQKLKTACGSPCYASPQMLNREPYDPKKIDIWSSGIILYAMVCGYLPFEDQVTAKLYEKIKTSNVKLPSWVSSPCRNLIRGLLTKDPKLRFDVDSILSHEMITPHLETLKQTIRQRQLTENKIQDICEMYDIEEKEKLVSDLNKNRHNNLTTLYYLAVKRIQKQEKQQFVLNENRMKEFKKEQNKDLQIENLQLPQCKQQPNTQMKSQQVDQAIFKNEMQKIQFQKVQQNQTNEERIKEQQKAQNKNQINQDQSVQNKYQENEMNVNQERFSQQKDQNKIIDESNKNTQSLQKESEQCEQLEVQNPYDQQLANQHVVEDEDKQNPMGIEQNDKDKCKVQVINENQGQKKIQDEEKIRADSQKMQQQEQNMLSDEQLQVHRLHEEINYELKDIDFNQQNMMQQENQQRIRDIQKQQSFINDTQIQIDRQKDLNIVKDDQGINIEFTKTEDKVEQDNRQDKVEQYRKIQIQQEQKQQSIQAEQVILQKQSIKKEQPQNVRQQQNKQNNQGPQSIIEQSYQLSMEIQKTLQQLNQMANLQKDQINVNGTQNKQISHFQSDKNVEIQNEQNNEMLNGINQQIQNGRIVQIQNEQINFVQNNLINDIQVNQLNHNKKQQSINHQMIPRQQQDTYIVTNHEQEDNIESQKLTEAHFDTITNIQNQQQILQSNNYNQQQSQPIESQIHQPQFKQNIKPDQKNKQLNNQPHNNISQRFLIQAQPVNYQHNLIEQPQPIGSQQIILHQQPKTQIIQPQQTYTDQQVIKPTYLQVTSNSILSHTINKTQVNPLQQQTQQLQQNLSSYNQLKTPQQSLEKTQKIPRQQNIDLQQAQLIQQIQIIQNVINKKQPQIHTSNNIIQNQINIQPLKPQNKLLRQNNKKNHLFSTQQVLPQKQQTQKLNQKEQKQTIQNKHQSLNTKKEVKNILAARNIRLNQRSHSKDTPIIFKSNKNKPTLKPQTIKDQKKKSLSKQKNPKLSNKQFAPKKKKSQQKQSNYNKVLKKQPVRQKFVIAKDKKPQKKQKFTSKEQSKIKSYETLKSQKNIANQKSLKQDEKMFKTIGISAIKQQPQGINNKVESKSRLKSTSLIIQSSKRFSGYGNKFKKNTNDQSKQHNIPISPISGIKTKDISTPFNSIKLTFQNQHKTLVNNLKQQEEQNSSPSYYKEKEKNEVKKIQISKPRTFFENVKTKSFLQYSSTNINQGYSNNSSTKITISTKYGQSSPGQNKLNKTIGSFSQRSSKESQIKQKSLLMNQKQQKYDNNNFGIRSNTKSESQYSQSHLNSSQVIHESHSDFGINFSAVEPQLINPELILFVSAQQLYHLIESFSQSKNNTFSNIIGTLQVYQYPTKDYMYVLNSNLFKSQQILINNKKSSVISHNKSSPLKKKTKIGTFEFVELINSIVLSE